MPDGFSISMDRRGQTQLNWTLALIAGIWIASDIGYYFLLPALGEKSDYNDGPIATALYYVFWTGIATIALWPQYSKWPRYARWDTFGNRLTSIIIWSLAFAAIVMFAAYILPLLPPFNPREGISTPELPLATPWYFLPKSIEILFQQLLVVALVLALSAKTTASGRYRFVARPCLELRMFCWLSAMCPGDM